MSTIPDSNPVSSFSSCRQSRSIKAHARCYTRYVRFRNFVALGVVSIKNIFVTRSLWISIYAVSNNYNKKKKIKEIKFCSDYLATTLIDRKLWKVLLDDSTRDCVKVNVLKNNLTLNINSENSFIFIYVLVLKMYKKKNLDKNCT